MISPIYRISGEMRFSMLSDLMENLPYGLHNFEPPEGDVILNAIHPSIHLPGNI